LAVGSFLPGIACSWLSRESVKELAMWWQNYRDHGLLGKLLIFAVLSYGLTATM
jgi:hypothetical protein